MKLKQDTTMSSPTLPHPRGPHPVGYMDLLTEGTPHTSSLLRVYYPATEDKPTIYPLWKQENSPAGLENFVLNMIYNLPQWVPEKDFKLNSLARTLSPFATSMINCTYVKSVRRNVKIPICRGVEISNDKPKLPVVVFSHGMGCTRSTLSQLCYQMSSQGVVVVAVEHREGSSCETFFMSGKEKIVLEHLPVSREAERYVRGTQVELRAEEIVRAVEMVVKINKGEKLDNVFGDYFGPLTGRLDVDSMLLMGHSFGGGSVLLAASRLHERIDLPEVKGLVVLDPWMFPLSCIDETPRLSPLLDVLMINTGGFHHENNINMVHDIVRGRLEEHLMKDATHLGISDISSELSGDFMNWMIGLKGKKTGKEDVEDTLSLVWNWMDGRL